MIPARDGPEPDRTSSDNTESVPEQQAILLRRRVAAFGLSSVLFLATLLWTSSYGIHSSPEASPVASLHHRLRTGIDPNTAHWFEIAQLPGIGEALAKRVEDFRRRNQSERDPAEPVFRAPADLAQVRGIGDKTVQRISPFLRWPDPGALR